jgi:hypothetical protein
MRSMGARNAYYPAESLDSFARLKAYLDQLWGQEPHLLKGTRTASILVPSFLTFAGLPAG